MKERYDLKPRDGRKSFYGKAFVEINEDGSKTLFSYNTPIITRTATGDLVRLWNGWSATTGRHIKAYCGLNKAMFTALPVNQDKFQTSNSGRVLTNEESYSAMIARRAMG